MNIFILLAACAFNMCTISMGAAIPEMQEVFGQSSLAVIQMSMNFAGIAAASISLLQSKLQEKFSYRTLLITGLLLFSGAGIGAYFFHANIVSIFVWTGMMGIGCGMYYPLISSIITERFSGMKRGGLLAAQTAISNLGGIIMSLLGGILVAWKWYGCFIVNLLGVPVLVLCIWSMPREPRSVEKRKVEDGRIDWKLIAKYFSVSFTFALVYFVATPNISVFVEEQALGGAELSGMGTAALMLGGMIAGFIYKKVLSALRGHIVELGILTAGVGYILMALSTRSAALLLVGGALTGASFGFVIPYFLYLISMKANKATLGTAMGVVGTCAGALSSFISPLIFTQLGSVMGLLTARSRFIAAAICCVVLVGLHWYLRTRLKGGIYEEK